MYFQLVDNQVLSTQGQPDVNLHRLTLVKKRVTAERSSTAGDFVAQTVVRRCRLNTSG